jgi:hypothetical protein
MCTEQIEPDEKIKAEREKILAKRKSSEFVNFINSPENAARGSVFMNVKAVKSEYPGLDAMYYIILTDNNYHLQAHLKGELPVHQTGNFAMPMKFMYRQVMPTCY